MAAATVLAAVLLTASVGAIGTLSARGTIYTPRNPAAPPAPVDAAQAPEHDSSKPTAVVVLGSKGANAADVLAPYEVLAVTDEFNLYTIAPQRQPVPLTGGLDIIPDLSFSELDDRLGGSPDVIVVPQLPEVDDGEPSAAQIIEWLQRQNAQANPLFVGVCVGARAFASAGLLDGRPATSHWLGLIGLRRDYPSVPWQEGVRFVDDGDMITTAGVLSGVDGALRVVERFYGQAAAAQAARAVAWPDFSPGGAAPMKQPQLAPADVVALLSAGYRWDRPSMGVLLTDGVGEIELASVFRPYTEFSYLSSPVAVTQDGRPIRSRHGLTFAPRSDVTTVAPNLRRLVVPGGDAARRAVADGLATPERLPIVYLHTQPGFAFDGALQDIARTRDVATANWVAKTLQYPNTNPQLSGPAWPWSLTLRPIMIAAAAIAAILSIQLLRRRAVTLRGPALRRFVRHYLELVVAIVAGMVVLDAAESVLLTAIGWTELRARPESAALVMCTNMAIAVVAWMRFRGRSGVATMEMVAAMYVPFVALFPLLWLGVLSATGLMLLGHVLLLLAIAAALLRHTGVYTRSRSGERPAVTTARREYREIV